MPLSTPTLPLAGPALPALARWLLSVCPATSPEDLADVLVLLPSTRTCGQLGQALVEASGQPALMLPRILTPGRLADQLADMLGLDEADDCQPALRSVLLAPLLARRNWLQDRPEAASGLAVELVQLFDEVRLAGCEAQVLEGADDEALLALADDGGADVLKVDLDRIRDAWTLYRGVVSCDVLDRRCAALRAAAKTWPGPRPSLTACAHLGRLDRATADLLAGLAAGGAPVHWIVPDADDPRSRLLLSSYRDATDHTHPLASIRGVVESLGATPPEPPVFAGTDLPTRLDELGSARDDLAPTGALQLRPCREPEHESRVIAATVCETLAAAETVPEILIATPDRNLAARVAAQLRDAGVDVDDTRGRPLAGLPAGRLLRDLLRTAVGGVPYGPLFEVLTHPYTRLVEDGVRPGHAVRIRLLEAAVRRSGSARRGMGALLAAAKRDDDSAGAGRRNWSLEDFVKTIKTALAPLLDLPGNACSWPDALGAIGAVWTALTKDRPLDGSVEPRGDFDDLGALGGLLDALSAIQNRLESAGRSDIAATITALLADPACEVRPHRQRQLPVRLTGLVEARLEHADLLVLGGLSQDTFPGRLPRPLLLPDRVRQGLQLDHWRARAGRDAELMLRLLHAAPRTEITWPLEKEGQPSLPSPLVQRLLMVAPAPPVDTPEVELFRRELPDIGALIAAETAFRAEPEPIPAPDVAPPRKLSHTAMQRYRDCPYRFLLANALGLRRTDPIEASLTPMDVGNMAHAVMQAWLEPMGAGVRALAADDRDTALELLRRCAETVFAEGGKNLPGSAVALRSLLALGPDLVAAEVARLRKWRPAALEAEFTVTLQQTADWLAGEGETPPAIPADLADVELTGKIDRIDLARDGKPHAAVLDYKTGTPPSRKRTADGRELQVILYGLAVEAGTVEGLESPPGPAWRLDHGGYYALRRKGFGPHVHLERDGLAFGVRTILEQALAILDPAVPYALVPDWHDEDTSGRLPCTVCEFRGVCRLEERDATPALAARVTALLTAAGKGTP